MPFSCFPPKPSAPARRIRPILLAALGVALIQAGCNRGPSPRVLERRIERLEDKQELIEKRAEAAMLTAETGAQDLGRRLETVEQKSAEALGQTSNIVSTQEARFQRVEQTLNNVMRMKEQSEAVAYLDRTTTGHRTLKTEHGTFLVRIESIEKNTAGSGYTVQLNIGNSMGLEVQEYRLKGDFGLPAPKLQPGEAYGDYSKRLDEWQKTLTPFEETLTDPILPNAWSRASLTLNAPNEERLQLVRVAMTVQRAKLANQEGKGEFSVINAASDGAGLVKTDYGPLLVTVTGMAAEGAGTRVQVMVGNPFGFIINEGKISGQFGPSPPQKMATESPALYQNRLRLWSERMESFDSRFTGTIAPLRWSEASFVVPTSNQDNIKYLRVQMEISNITLPRTGPPRR